MCVSNCVNYITELLLTKKCISTIFKKLLKKALNSLNWKKNQKKSLLENGGNPPKKKQTISGILEEAPHKKIDHLKIHTNETKLCHKEGFNGKFLDKFIKNVKN